MARNILSEAEIKDIQDTVGELFAEELDGTLKIDVLKLKNQLDYIINKVKIIENMRKSSKTGKMKQDGWRIKRTSMEKRKLMAETYLIIFKFRTFLLNEEIDYRYYYNTSDGGAGVTSFTEHDILKYMKMGRTGISICDNILQQREQDETYQALLDTHFANLQNGMQKAKDSSFLIVHKYIMSSYGGMNPGLRNQKTNRYQVFTRGHLFEAIDIAFSEAMMEGVQDSYSAIEEKVYGHYLSYDSIPGTQGGDNAITNTQIKANSADLLDYSTLLKDLQAIKGMLEPKSKGELKEEIKKLFISKDKSGDAMDLSAEKALDKLLKSLVSSNVTLT